MTQGGNELLGTPEGRSTYERAIAVCREKAQVERDAATVDGLVEVVQQLRDIGACARYLQGGVLARLQEQGRWRQRRADLSFAEFCEQEVGFSYRTAKYLIDCYQQATRLGLTPERIREIGWTKLREFLPLASAENVDDWIVTAKTSTRPELRERIRVEKAARAAAAGAEPSEPLLPWSVRVTAEQREFIDMVIEEAAASAPPRILSRGYALEMLCLDWLANRLPREKSLDWLLAQIARVYGERVAVVPRHP